MIGSRAQSCCCARTRAHRYCTPLIRLTASTGAGVNPPPTAKKITKKEGARATDATHVRKGAHAPHEGHAIHGGPTRHGCCTRLLGRWHGSKHRTRTPPSLPEGRRTRQQLLPSRRTSPREARTPLGSLVVAFPPATAYCAGDPNGTAPSSWHQSGKAARTGSRQGDRA